MMLLSKEEAVEKGWLRTSENQDKLIDHYFYLVTHCDYGTPMKAKYHDDMGGIFEIFGASRFTEFINPILYPCKCKYFMELPEMPEDYKEVDEMIADYTSREDTDKNYSKENREKHGHWSECFTDTHHYSGICSVCGKASIKTLTESLYDYCPKCGARMDGDKNEDY